ncbi:MAG: 2-oxo acid dehydrogenase subunit E2 [Aquamicrobium sp.]|uniref:dihydrolipoamide acetyltransferase family protein n=1 Tax=Aquamicrobium sp. TaxID=1872579 RepID=UPI00349E7A40|nr:2-oxo acid dehydrogenase subunit E2 [Aquamicrobium sp.]
MSEIVMPKFGLTMTEGLIAAWRRKPGEPFRQGDVLFEVETEKVTNEVEAAADGVLAEILFPEGATVPVGEVIARLAGGASAPAAASPATPARGEDAPSARKLMAEHGVSREAVEGSGRDGRVMKEDVLRVIATPLARRIARQEGIDLSQVAGSGPGGRIKAADVEGAKAAPAPSPSLPSALAQPDSVRAATARRVQAAKRDIPHFYLTRHVDIRALAALRAELNAQAGRAKLSVTHMLVKAAGLALAAHPGLNRVWLPDGILALDTVGVGIVAETPQGLRIPVLDRADRLALDDLALAMGGLLERARTATLTSADVSGGAISISNVGMHGADTLTPIINPPQAMILGVGAEQQLFRPDAAGQPELCREIVLTLAADHRLIDGADAARFLATLAGLLETPLALLRSPPST